MIGGAEERESEGSAMDGGIALVDPEERDGIND